MDRKSISPREYLNLAGIYIRHGTHLMTYCDDSYIVSLYYEGSNFIEVKSNVRDGAKSTVIRFKSASGLDPYLEFIDLDFH